MEKTSPDPGTLLPAAFTDATGREWRINLTYGDVLRIEKATGLDLMDDLQASLERIQAHKPAAINAIYTACCCGGDGAAPAMTEEQFCDGLDGGAIQAALSALVAAIVNFTHHGKAREAIAAAMARAVDLEEQRAAALAAEIQAGGLDQALRGDPSPPIADHAGN